MQRLECEVTFTLLDEAPEYAVEILFADGNAVLLKVIIQVAKMLLRERILLIGECSLFCLCPPELIDEVTSTSSHSSS